MRVLNSLSILLTLALLIPASPGKLVSAQEPAASPPAAPGKPKPKHTNRLAKETSPYLLLHAHNPVDWYPWGDEALAKAKRENKLIFLSVGYSSCHWCHVMERESFMDREIADWLNRHFVCVKVDREERPDVDTIYMTAVQVYHQMTQGRRSGGWPMSVFLLPDTKPFFGGTYFPARDGDRGAPMGFLTLIKKIQEIWAAEPEKLRQDAATLTRALQTELDGRHTVGVTPLARRHVDAVLEGLSESYDKPYGGFGYSELNPQRPKFPEPSNLLFLIHLLQREQGVPEAARQQARTMLVGTLEKMAQGGIRDHLGGGFHRYSVDRYWRIPHFEKMLYDQGQLATAYVEAYALTGDASFRRVTVELLEFVLRELTAPSGAFYAALDAESDGEEGKYYRWSREEVRGLLGDQYPGFAAAYGLDREPNFEDHYALQLSQPLKKLAEQQRLAPEKLVAQLAPLRGKLLAARNQRARPLTDTKVLTSWNGLMIRGFADAGRVLKEPKYVAAAERAAKFLLTHLRRDDGTLARTYSQGEAKLNAYLDDYAFLVDGLLALHRATGQPQWLQEADQLTEVQLKRFWDERNGGFYFTSDNHQQLLARAKNPIDGAQPAGNTVAAENLLTLAQRLPQPAYRERVDATLRSVSLLLERSPQAAPRMAVVLARVLDDRPAQPDPNTDKP